MTPWSDLLPEILNSIVGKLDFYEDFINLTTTIALFPGDMSGLSPATCRWGNLS
ncbi:hypothetical protein Tco_1333516, partial [Tanacetum coccineum]